MSDVLGSRLWTFQFVTHVFVMIFFARNTPRVRRCSRNPCREEPSRIAESSLIHVARPVTEVKSQSELRGSLRKMAFTNRFLWRLRQRQSGGNMPWILWIWGSLCKFLLSFESPHWNHISTFRERNKVWPIKSTTAMAKVPRDIDQAAGITRDGHS